MMQILLDIDTNQVMLLILQNPFVHTALIPGMKTNIAGASNTIEQIRLSTNH